MGSIRTLFIIFTVLCLFGCGSAPQVISYKDAPLQKESRSPSRKMMMETDGAVEKIENQSSTLNRKVIKTGVLNFETDDPGKTRQIILSAVESNNGYISRDHQRKRDDRVEQTIEVRVPADNFDSLLSEILKSVGNLDRKSINVKDVTEEFFDIKARLKTKKELEKRYLQLLDRAGAVKDVLAIEREIGKLRESIESIEGRLKYLRDQIAFSTLTISFYYRIGTIKGLSLLKLKNSLATGWNNFLDFFIFIIKFWPFIIIITLVFLWIRRSRRRRKARKDAAKDISANERKE